MLDQRLFDRPIAYHPWLAKAVGGVTRGILLSQLLYWQKTKDKELNPSLKDSKNDGWVWKTEAEWREETALSVRELKSAIKGLVELKIIEIKEERLLHKRYFKVNLAKLEELSSNKRISREYETSSREDTKRNLVYTESTYRDVYTTYRGEPEVRPSPEVTSLNTDPDLEQVNNPNGDIPLVGSTSPNSLPVQKAGEEAGEEFDDLEYINEKLINSNMPHLNLLGNLFLFGGWRFKSYEALQAQIRRNSKAAVDILKEGWTTADLEEAVGYMIEQPFYKQNPPTAMNLQIELPKMAARRNNKC